MRDNEREIVANAKTDLKQRIERVQKALSILRDHNGAETHSELDKNRIGKSLINDDVDGRRIQRTGHRLRLRKATPVGVAMSAFAGEHNPGLVPTLSQRKSSS